jgi:acid phosphatase type 7
VTPPSSDIAGTGAFERAVLVGAGDIGDCNSPGSALTAQLLDTLEGTVFTAGDNAYPSGSAEQYRTCYDTTWGRHRGRTRPSAGNHEYETAGAAPYFSYFGGNAGPPGLGYYSYSAGAWHVVVLNSEAPTGGGSAQEQWLRGDLASHPARCTIAYWHKPLFSSGSHGGDRAMQDIWRALYEFKVEIVVNAHDHLYERFAPQDPSGSADPMNGIREFVVGTGGGGLSGPMPRSPNSELQAQAWGVLMLVLHPANYRWQFISVDGSASDAGETACH